MTRSCAHYYYAVHLYTLNIQDYKELKERHIVVGSVSPAAALLEKNLVANHVKQQVHTINHSAHLRAFKLEALSVSVHTAKLTAEARKLQCLTQ
jgi:hypothetical protein